MSNKLIKIKNILLKCIYHKAYMNIFFKYYKSREIIIEKLLCINTFIKQIINTNK